MGNFVCSRTGIGLPTVKDSVLFI